LQFKQRILHLENKINIIGDENERLMKTNSKLNSRNNQLEEDIYNFKIATTQAERGKKPMENIFDPRGSINTLHNQRTNLEGKIKDFLKERSEMLEEYEKLKSKSDKKLYSLQQEILLLSD